jgi:hypothetical protein
MIFPFLPFPIPSSTSSFRNHIFHFLLPSSNLSSSSFLWHLPLIFPFLITGHSSFFSVVFIFLILVSCDLCTTIELYNTAAVSNLIICYASNNGDWMWDHYLQHELIFFPHEWCIRSWWLVWKSFRPKAKNLKISKSGFTFNTKYL